MKRRNVGLGVVCAGLFFAGAPLPSAAPGARAQTGPAASSAAGLLPESTALFARVRSWPAFSAFTSASLPADRLAALRRALSLPIPGGLIPGSRDALVYGRRAIRFLDAHARGEVALAILSVSGRKGFAPVPEAALLIDCGDGGGATRALEAARRAASAFAREAGLSFEAGAVCRLSDGEVTIAFGTAGGRLVIATSEAALASLIQRSLKKEKGEKRLADTPAFRIVTERLGSGAGASVYVAAAPLWKLGEAYAPALSGEGLASHPVARMLGLSDLAAAGYALERMGNGEGFRETILFHQPSGCRGLFKWIAVPPMRSPPRDLACVPADAAGCSSWRVNPREVLDEILAALPKHQPEFYRAQVTAALALAEREIGFSISNFLGQLEGEGVSYVPLGATEEEVYLIRLKDPEAFRPFLVRAALLLQGIPGMTLAREGSGEEETFVLQPAISAPGIPSVAFCLVADRLVVSTGGRAGLRAVCERIGPGTAGEAESLADTERYRRSVARLRTGAGSLSYLLAGGLCRRAAAGLDAPGLAGMGMPPEARLALRRCLAAAEAHVRDWEPFVFASAIEPSHMAMEMIGPVPALGPTCAGAAGVAAAAVLFPAWFAAAAR